MYLFNALILELYIMDTVFVLQMQQLGLYWKCMRMSAS